MIQRLLRHPAGLLAAALVVTAPAAAVMFAWDLNVFALVAAWLLAAAGAASLFNTGETRGQICALMIAARRAERNQEETGLPMLHTPPPWFDEAMETLEAQVFSSEEEAQQRLTRLLEAYGHQVIPQLLCVWIDNAAHRAGIPVAASGVGLSFAKASPDNACEPEEVPPPLRWAGRFLAARIACDPDQYAALINTVPDGDAWMDNATTMLTMCGQMTHSAWQAGAEEVLAHTVVGAVRPAETALSSLYSLHGPTGITAAMLFWIDETLTTLRQRVPGLAAVKLDLLTLAAEDTDRDHLTWATQLVEARLAANESQQRDMLDAITDHANLLRHARSVLRICATLLDSTAPATP